MPLRQEPVELGELCRAVGAEFVLAARERGTEVDVVAPPGPCWAAGDPGAVARVVRILLDNALRYSPERSAVRVTPAYHGGWATVDVSDQGPGVAEEDRERIFARFQRGTAKADGGGGFGLGLAIGRELAIRMGGDAGAHGSARGRVLPPAPAHRAAGRLARCRARGRAGGPSGLSAQADAEAEAARCGCGAARNAASWRRPP